MTEKTTFDLDLKTLRRPPLRRRLRLGFVGGGRGGLVGQWHAAGARLSNHWDIVAGALSSDSENARLSGQDWMIAEDRSYHDWRQMAARESARPDGIEAVVVCTPNHLHHAIAAGFLQAGIDVICDKPMTTTLQDAEDLARLDAAGPASLFLTYPYPHHAMARQAALMIAGGAIGKIRQMHAEYLQEWATGPSDPSIKGRAWRQDAQKAGRSSAIGDIGTHAIHLLEYVSGLPTEALRADFHICGAAKDLEDTAFVNLRMQGGVPGFLHITQAAPGQYCGLRLRIWGEIGGIAWDQEFPEQIRYSRLGEPDRIIHRGHGSGILPAAEQLVHLPRAHGEALTDAWGNLYAEIAVAIAARKSGVSLPDGEIRVWTVGDGIRGVRFVHACADSHEAGGTWVTLTA